MLKKLAYIGLFVFLASGFAHAEEYDEGFEYKRIAEQPTDSGDKIEVLEFFWYGCPHCYQFEPTLTRWLKTKPSNVEFIRVPAVFRPDWKVHARTYYALQALDLVEKYHSVIFDGLHKEKLKLYNKDAMVDFLVSRGVNKEEFEAAYNSFSIDGQLRKAINKVEAYGIQGVPSVAVNGKFLVTGKMAGTYEKMTKIMDYLIKQEEAATASAKK